MPGKGLLSFLAIQAQVTEEAANPNEESSSGRWRRVMRFLFRPGIRIQHFPHGVLPEKCNSGKHGRSNNNPKQAKQIGSDNGSNQYGCGVNLKRTGNNAWRDDIIKDLIYKKSANNDKQGVIERRQAKEVKRLDIRNDNKHKIVNRRANIWNETGQACKKRNTERIAYAKHRKQYRIDQHSKKEDNDLPA